MKEESPRRGRMCDVPARSSDGPACCWVLFVAGRECRDGSGPEGTGFTPIRRFTVRRRKRGERTSRAGLSPLSVLRSAEGKNHARACCAFHVLRFPRMVRRGQSASGTRARASPSSLKLEPRCNKGPRNQADEKSFSNGISDTEVTERIERSLRFNDGNARALHVNSLNPVVLI